MGMGEGASGTPTWRILNQSLWVVGTSLSGLRNVTIRACGCGVSIHFAFLCRERKRRRWDVAVAGRLLDVICGGAKHRTLRCSDVFNGSVSVLIATHSVLIATQVGKDDAFDLAT
jgi:hypothetical protein